MVVDAVDVEVVGRVLVEFDEELELVVDKVEELDEVGLDGLIRST